MRIHPSINEDMLLEAAQADDCMGFCTACGAEASGVEPDTRKRKCESCGERAVYGAEELMMIICDQF